MTLTEALAAYEIVWSASPAQFFAVNAAGDLAYAFYEYQRVPNTPRGTLVYRIT